MITATELASFDKKRDDDILNQRIEWFIRHYQPEDREDAARFHMHLHELVRSIYAKACEPYEKTMHSMLMSLPLSPIFESKHIMKEKVG